jgi:UDP-glucose 4-epimerase
VSRDTTLVTGGAGFIGSEIVRQLHARGDRVLIVDNLANGRREHVADVLGDQVALQQADIRDIGALSALLPRVRIVFHLACLGVRHSIHSPYENHDVNATATLRLLQACRQAGVPRCVYVSSSEVYGSARSVPMTEEHPTLPSTVYGASKLAGECYARAYFRTYGYPTVIVRPFNTYGPRSHHEGDSGEVIPKFLLRAIAGRPLIVFGDGSQTRDFTFVSDTAAGILRAGECDAAVGETINLGSGREIGITDLARTVGLVTGRQVTLEHDAPRPGDVHRLCAGVSRASSLLGYSPRVSLEDGLRRLMAWYESLGVDAGALLEREVIRNWTSPQLP